MRPTQAKEHEAAVPPPGPCPGPPSGSPVRVRPDGGTGAAPGGIPAGLDDARVVDADVPAAVGRVLDHVLADRVARAHAVDALFAEELAGPVARFTRAGGKRIRSQLLWWALRACGGPDEPPVASALRIGAALELLQTCALVHDDVMDGSALRRGRPALHADLRARYADSATPERVGRFAEAGGLLAGDLALAWSDDMVAETPLAFPAEAVVRRLWSDLRTEMVAGQYLDVQGQITGSYSLPRALRAACLKSGRYSVERPLALGAALAGAAEATARALSSAGLAIGTAFQLRDDLDDVFAPSGRTGKPSGGDIREGKPTCLVALAHVRAEAKGDRLALAVLRRSLGDARLTEAGLDRVRSVLTRTGARAAVENRIGRLVAQGLRSLDGVVPEHGAGDRLRRLLASAADGAASDGGGPLSEEAGEPDPAASGSVASSGAQEPGR
ncbi:polyprenyl synthetase family protein [Streptomyces sp. NPDC053086]|uniref:polyprenyl synthetase family protein n=1 Tax=unclassified Streptomyces TaxID=2593676 RepID=UPI0037D677A7